MYKNWSKSEKANNFTYQTLNFFISEYSPSIETSKKPNRILIKQQLKKFYMWGCHKNMKKQFSLSQKLK